MNNFARRSARSFFNPFAKPKRELVGTCPLWKHKYYLIPEQVVNSTRVPEKREIEYHIDHLKAQQTSMEKLVAKMSKSEDIKLIHDMKVNKQFSIEWDSWLRYQRREPPTDSEIYMKKYTQQRIATAGNILEEQYKLESTRTPKEHRTVFVPTPGGGQQSASDDKKKYSSVGTTGNKKYSGQPKKDGLDEAEVESWDPSKM